MNPLIHAPIDKWSTREKLSLASSVLTAGDQNWYSVSRSLRPFGELNRPQDWFSQKNCALQYAELLENVETPKRKRGEKNEDTAQNLIVRKLTVERMKELKEEIEQDEKHLENLKKNINLLKNDNLSETDQKIIEKQMIDALEQEKRDEEAHELWLKEREEKYASISRKKSFALIKTPKKDDQNVSNSSKNTPSTPLSNQVQLSAQSTPQQQPSEEIPIDSNKNATTAEQQLSIKQEKLITQEISEQQVTANRIMTREKSKDSDKIQVVFISDDKRPSNEKSITEQLSKEDKTSDKQHKDKAIDQSSKVPDKSEAASQVAQVMKIEVDNTEATNPKSVVKSFEDERSLDEVREENESIASNKRKRTSTASSLAVSNTATVNTPTISQQQAQASTPQTRRSGRLNPLRSGTASKSEQSPAIEQSNQTPISKKPQQAQIIEEKPVVTPIKASQLMLNDESTKDSTTSDLTDTYTSPNSPASSILNIDQNDPEQMKEQKEFKTWKKSILLLWREIATHKFSTLFTSPVTDDEAKGYSTVVFRPIDLTTIRRKVESGEIRTTLEFQRDIMLMFQNAIMYNSVQHEVHQMTLDMQKEVLESIEDFINNQKSSSSSQTIKEAPSSRRKSRTT